MDLFAGNNREKIQYAVFVIDFRVQESGIYSFPIIKC